MGVEQQDVSGVEIIYKADSVLRVLEKNGEMTVAQIAHEVGEPVSSTYRLLTSLNAIGWVDPGSTRSLYRLGVLFMRVGGIVETRLDVRKIAAPLLRELHVRTQATCYIFVRRGLRAVCIEVLENGSVGQIPLRLGDSLALNMSAASRVLFSFLPASERDSIIEQFAAQPDDSTPSATEQRRALRNVARDRERGYVVSEGDITAGLVSIACPLFNHRGELVAALCVSGIHPTEMSAGGGEPDMIAAVTQTGRDISRGLGFEPESVDEQDAWRNDEKTKTGAAR